MQTLIEKLEVLLEAAKTGKHIQLWNPYSNSWTECHEIEPLVTSGEARLKPTPKLRPWRIEEVPLEGWFMDIDDNPYRISSVKTDGSEVLINGTWITLYELMRLVKWTLTPFDASSWKPCGVEE